jgi:hypothetical protein
LCERRFLLLGAKRKDIPRYSINRKAESEHRPHALTHSHPHPLRIFSAHLFQGEVAPLIYQCKCRLVVENKELIMALRKGEKGCQVRGFFVCFCIVGGSELTR